MNGIIGCLTPKLIIWQCIMIFSLITLFLYYRYHHNFFASRYIPSKNINTFYQRKFLQEKQLIYFLYITQSQTTFASFSNLLFYLVNNLLDFIELGSWFCIDLSQKCVEFVLWVVDLTGGSNYFILSGTSSSS